MLDAQRAVAPSAVLDCGPHMLLYFDQPQMMPYSSGFQTSCAAAIDWFRQHLDG